MDEKEKEDFSNNYGSYPPQHLDTYTKKVWDKHCKPWTPGSGDHASRLTEEEKNRLLKRPILDAIEKRKK